MRPSEIGLSLRLVVATALAGCSSSQVADGGAPVRDSGADRATGDATPDADATAPGCDGTGPAGFFVIRTLDFGRVDGPGRASGLDLDGLISDETDPGGCFQPDFVGADGTEGVDNQFAVLLPTLESALGTGVRALLQESVNAGEMLILLELTTGADLCTDMSLFIGQTRSGGPPALGADGLLEAGQTYDIDPASLTAAGEPLVHVRGVAVSGDEVTGAPVELGVEFTVGDTTVPFDIHRGTARFDVSGAGLTNGVIGGELFIDELVRMLLSLSGDSTVPGCHRCTLESHSDLSPDDDGICQSISVSVVFDAVRAVKGVTGS